MFVASSHPDPEVRFRRALNAGNVQIVLAAAKEVPRIALDDALRICLLLRNDPNRYDRAAVRWIGRFAIEARQVSLETLEAALDALSMLPDAPEQAMKELSALCLSHGIR